MKGLMIFIAVCALTTAMVPMERRAVNTEDEETLRTESTAVTSTTTEQNAVQICAVQTPCAWSIYKPQLKIVDLNITNTYCVCRHGTYCQVDEDDTAVNAYIFRCRKEGAARAVAAES